MTIFKKIVSALSVIAGVFFLTQVTSDIQFGFGLMMIFTGVLGYPNK
jgi:hypothetical protein